MSVKQRLISYLEYKNISKSEFGRTIGVSSAYVSSIRKSIDPDKIQSITLNYPDLNLDWLMTGEGEMIKSSKQSSLLINNGDVEFVPLLPISAQGGTLNEFVVSVKGGNDCEQIVSPIKGADFAITVSGDSMAPEFPNGAQILIKKINAKAFIDWGKVYVLDTCNGTVIKILVPSDNKEYVRCLSINPEPRYAPFDIAFEDVYGFYRVMMCMSVK